MNLRASLRIPVAAVAAALAVAASPSARAHDGDGHDAHPNDPKMPRAGQTAPAFAAKDAAGRPFASGSLKGGPAVLWFFCGCDKCAEVATKWGEFQRGGALPAADAKEGVAAPRTVLVYAGSAEEVQGLAARAALDAARTTLVPDPDLSVSYDRYHSDPCPRVFVLDRAGRIVYVNAGTDDRPRDAPALLIASRALEALRKAAAPAAPASPKALRAPRAGSPRAGGSAKRPVGRG